MKTVAEQVAEIMSGIPIETWENNNKILDSVMKKQMENKPKLLRIWHDGIVTSMRNGDFIDFSSFTTRENTSGMEHSHLIHKINEDELTVEIKLNRVGSTPITIEKHELTEEYGFFHKL
jgi:hypothetical protein